MAESNIKIFVRSVEWTAGLAQHIYIINTNSKGEQKILRAGPQYNSMLKDDLKVVYVPYVESNENLIHSDWNPKNEIEIYTITGTDAEIQAKMDKMWEIGERVNNGNYDYKVPVIFCPPVICHVQNSNTVGYLMAKSIGIDLRPILLEKKLWAPGVDGRLDHTIMDKFVKTSLENNAEYKANLAKYGEYTEEEFKVLGLDYIMAQNKENIKADQIKSLQEYANFEQLMQDLKLNWEVIITVHKSELSKLRQECNHMVEKETKALFEERENNLLTAHDSDKTAKGSELQAIADAECHARGKTRCGDIYLKYGALYAEYEFSQRSLLATEIAKLKTEYDMRVLNNQEECENRIMNFFNDKIHIKLSGINHDHLNDNLGNP
ncbi:hypothetical protein NOVO_00305 [Rickettsiales bacterium Ac37b]|nr:hypothetical protein NOVO_00305 [Rickettsiales bacterium Ac37b]